MQAVAGATGNTAADSTEQPMLETVKVHILPDGRMDRENAAKYLGYATKTLAMWELEKKGPPSIKVGGRRFYFKDVLDNFIQCAALLVFATLLSVVAISFIATTFLVA